jgi:carbohydrate-selective porin OprB
MFSLGFSDPFGRKQGDLLAVMAGQPPSIIEVGGFAGSTGLSATADSYHFEAFYRFTVNDNISITPGFFIVTNPGNFEDNNTIAVGVVRTTFRF